MAWHVVAASATGRAHLDRGQPCQDAFAAEVVDGVLVAVVCDGAGSAAHADVGARTVASATVQALAARLRWGKDLLRADAAAAGAAFGDALASVRGGLEAQAAAAHHDLRDYACTVVGVAAGAAGGWLFHIGDGVAVVESAQAPALVSRPDNGEYANETYFLSGPQWRERLRLTRIAEPATQLALMSDGAQAFAMARGDGGLYPPFIDPVARYLRGVDAAQGARALQATLADPRTDAITGDDKTLLLAWPERG
ncbi:protein phosphatase 2C domain-containing protein [Luteimonas sp. BDR2-5]|uniref:PP2C family serine/threonine-protein phosphatase n=1 Tax=Proluteimonas luteida TaxID=2878685 RepID=UPI001E4C3E12|nr:PP2C family serine/threonine-protein phosphatase [Luteimonas sp. BDR2-5]MCD9028139.1 protein phosphatase 2C domain-containing protein [Luteimonas sp. BDR2-5]